MIRKPVSQRAVALSGLRAGACFSAVPRRRKFVPLRRRAREGLRIRYEKLDELREHPDNLNKHTAEQITLLERLLAEFGWTNPVGMAGGVLVYGHARRQAARNPATWRAPIPGNKDPDKGPVADLSHLSKA